MLHFWNLWFIFITILFSVIVTCCYVSCTCTCCAPQPAIALHACMLTHFRSISPPWVSSTVTWPAVTSWWMRGSCSRYQTLVSPETHLSMCPPCRTRCHWGGWHQRQWPKMSSRTSLMCKGKIIPLETVYKHIHIILYIYACVSLFNKWERETKLMHTIFLHPGFDSCELVEYVYL